MRSTLGLIILVTIIMSSVSGGATRLPSGDHLSIGSRTWPDLVGKDADEAKNIILAESPYLLVQILPEHAMVTMDYNTRRIRIFCNSERKVTKVPGVG
ncbi:hypothetical protein CY35_03G003100 [Sphagnum magellanicum]|jgi:hypothetical protein|nr:hypothetical protein CY35_03G003100 [Sphagnum magellanicum]